MTLEARRRETLLKTVRGPSFRRAMKAVAELRTANDPTLAAVVAAYRPRDAQRGAQYQIAGIVLAHGVRGLVSEWPDLADETWRAELISEIEQALDLWIDEATVDLVLTALEDPSREVRAKGVWGLRSVLAHETLSEWMTPARRARATRDLVAMLEHQLAASEIVLPQIVDALGHTATRDDGDAVRALEALRPRSGEPYLVTHEALDESKLDWRDRLLAVRKGIAPERIKVRIMHRPTGLLDQKRLEAALQRIRARSR